MQTVWTAIDTPPLCDKFSNKGWGCFVHIYKCPNCSRAYDAFDGYYDLVDGHSNWTRAFHNSAVRSITTRCALPLFNTMGREVFGHGDVLRGCTEEKITTGENYTAER